MPGHLHVGGLGVTRGYFEDPQRTSPVLVPDHLSGIAGARLYKTGDRARFMPDGRMAYLGRFDFQLKLRGFRIEPGDIEKALLHIPGVHQAVAVILKAQTPRLLAYLEPHGGVELPPVSHIRSFWRNNCQPTWSRNSSRPSSVCRRR